MTGPELTEAERAHLSRLFEDNHFTLLTDAVERILAARVSTATGDTDLRDRVTVVAERWAVILAEVLAESPSSIFNDRSVITLDGCLRELRAVLAASPAPRPEDDQ